MTTATNASVRRINDLAGRPALRKVVEMKQFVMTLLLALGTAFAAGPAGAITGGDLTGANRKLGRDTNAAA
jgi:hypothetical protein